MILLTGHKGFIGRNLHKHFRDRNRDVYGLDAKDGDVFEQLAEVPWHKITEIYHQGAISSTTELDVDKVYRHNIKFSISMFNIAADYQIPVKYASSGSVYGNTRGQFLSPLNYYALSKMTVDLWVLDNIKRFKNIVGFRYFNVYGADEQKDDFSTSPVYRFSEQAKKDGVIKVFTGSQNTYRDFICIEDIIHIITDDHRPGIYDLGTTKPISFMEVAELVARKYDATIKFIPFPEVIKGRYQIYTQAKADYDHKFLSVEEWLDSH